MTDNEHNDRREERREDRREMTYVTTHDGDRDGNDSGIAAIFHAFIKNPGAALQILLFIGSMYGLYYAMQGEITDVRAAQIQNFDKLNTKLEQLAASDTAQQIKLDTLFNRGDTRYTNIIAKLSSHDIDIAKIVASLDFIVEQYKGPSNQERAAPPRIRPSNVPAIP